MRRDLELNEDPLLMEDLAGPADDRLRREDAFARSHPGFVSAVGAAAGTRDNEFVLWNYLVGSAEPRPEHNAVLARIGPRWRRELAQNPALRVRIVGSASGSTGTLARNRRVALARARRVAQILVNVFSIPAARIDVEGVGADLPLADEATPDDPMNMARDRRVELLLRAPAHLVSAIAGVSVRFPRVTTTLDARPELRSRDESEAGIVAGRSFGIEATGRATWSGPPDAMIGFLQFVTADLRRGFYRSTRTGRTVAVDYGRCSVPFLPCADLTDSAQLLSVPGRSGTGRFERVVVTFVDRPGHAVPRVWRDPVAGPCSLIRPLWSMDFMLVFGVRLLDQFLAVEHVLWRAASTRPSPSGIPVPGMIAVRLGGAPGAPPGLPFARAMAGASCRLLTRTMDLCGGNDNPRGCPPRVCAPAVTRR